MPRYELTVPAELAGRRLDVAITQLVPGLSVAAVRVLVDQGRVGVTGEPARARRPVCAGEHVVVDIPDPAYITPSHRPIAILYEDPDLFVVDKPAGLVIHPAGRHRDDTLLNALAGHIARSGQGGPVERLHPVHRLDRDTSGLVVVARSQRAHRYLAAQWERHTVIKRYVALVHRQPEPAQGVIDLPLARHPGYPKRMISSPDGQPARTRYTTVGRYGQYSLLEVEPETGRMHQIRVHLATCGYPIAGDGWYGTDADTALPELARPFLHAHLLAIRLPSTRETREFRSALPPDLAAALNRVQ